MYAQLDYLGYISVSGTNAAKFLQNQLTCDIAKISESQTQLGAWCNPQGRVLCIFRVILIEQDYYLQLPSSMITLIVPLLQKYAVFSKVTITDASAEYQTIGLMDGMPELLSNYLLHLPAKTNACSKYDNIYAIRIDSSRVMLITTLTKWRALTNSQVPSASEDSWIAQDLAIGIPAIEPATSGLFTPHALNLPSLGMVSFNKGCYPGQEIVARTQYLGKSKQALYYVDLSTKEIVHSGDNLINQANEIIGTIVNSCQMKNDGYKALAVLNTANTKKLTLSKPLGELNILSE